MNEDFSSKGMDFIKSEFLIKLRRSFDDYDDDEDEDYDDKVFIIKSWFIFKKCEIPSSRINS